MTNNSPSVRVKDVGEFEIKRWDDLIYAAFDLGPIVVVFDNQDTLIRLAQIALNASAVFGSAKKSEWGTPRGNPVDALPKLNKTLGEMGAGLPAHRAPDVGGSPMGTTRGRRRHVAPQARQ